jgi:glutamyl-tRNA(Gln) amidotransferase subunit D
MVQKPPYRSYWWGHSGHPTEPSSDAALNLIHATTAAGHGDIAEVMVCMFGPTSDEYGFLHRGTRVRKMHSSYRSTFRTIGDIPVATVRRGEVKSMKPDYNPRRKDRNVTIMPYFNENVTMIYFYPHMKVEMFHSLIDMGYKGIIIVGTGLGHVNRELYPALERAQKRTAVYMALQTIWGYVPCSCARPDGI